jgi:cardiolipin synthase
MIKKKLGKIFNRITIVVLLVLLQMLWLFNAFWLLSQYAVWLNALFTCLSVFMVLYLIRKDLNPAYKIAWILPCCLAPLFGGMMYLMFGDKRPSKDMRRRMEAVEKEHVGALAQTEDVQKKMNPQNVSISRYLSQYGPYPAWENTRTDYYALGDTAYLQILEDLKAAKHYIFVEFFIISEGEMWQSIYTILKQKAAAGVDVRVIYDDVGSVAALPRHFIQELEQNGIHCMAFNPMMPILALVMNHRDHRKILVIDGRIAYTGGINLADEYINRISRFGHWKDSAVRLEGAAVWNFTVMFLNMWDAFHTEKHDDYDAYRPEAFGQSLPESDGIVQPYTDSPLDEEALGENVYLDILGQAQNYVYIFTPYLVIDNEMMTALRLAAKRGVDVRIVVPGIPDKKIVYRLTRSYFPPLLKSGVKIYTYTPGFIHAKSFVCDDHTAVVGTINLDYRSLYLHFECGVLFSGCRMVGQVKQDCLDTFEKSHLVQLGECRDSFLGSLFDDVLRLLSPLL